MSFIEEFYYGNIDAQAYNPEFGAKLKKKLNDLTELEKQIAELLNIKQNTYSQYEIGVLNYPIEVLMKLADFYGVSVDYLLGRTNVKVPFPKR